jgi:hypothetical protein
MAGPVIQRARRAIAIAVGGVLASLVVSAPALASPPHAATAKAPTRARTALRFTAVSGVRGANHLLLRRVGANLRLLDTDTGTVLRDVALARTSSVSIRGANGRIDNTLTLDFSGGRLAVPGGISYAGGRGGYNVLALRGGRFATEREVAYTPHSGLIVLGDTTVRYAEIAPVNDTAPAANLTINGTAAAETINVVDGPPANGFQTTQVNSAGSTFELINFANKANVTINGNGGGDTFDLNSSAPAAGLSSLTVGASSGGGTSSTFNVLAMPTAVSVSLVGGGTDTANIGTGSVQSISSPVTITDPPSFINVNVNDSADASSSRFVTLSGGAVNTISGLSQSTIAAKASDLASLTVRGGSAGNTFAVSGVAGPSGVTLPVTLDTGTGVDSSFVQNVAAGISLAIHGQNGADGVSVSNAGSVQGILGPVSVDNVGARTNLVVDDSNDTTARAASLSTDGTTDTISGLAPSAITGKVTDLTNITLDGGSGGNTVTFAGAGAAVPATLNTGPGADTIDVHTTTSTAGLLTIDGQGGNNAVNLGSAGGVQGIVSPVDVVGTGRHTTLTVDDSNNSSSSRFVTLSSDGTNDTISGLSLSTIAGQLSALASLTVDGGSAGNTFVISGTGAGLPVALNAGAGVDSAFVQGVGTGSSVAIQGQNGTDGVAVGNAGTAQGILGPISIGNTSGRTSLVIDDSSDTSARLASLSTDGATDTISGIAPANVTAASGVLSLLTVDGGTGGNTFTFAGPSVPATLNTGAGADTTLVQATSRPLNVNGQSGKDTVNLGNAGSVQGIVAPVTVTNGGATALAVNDASDTAAHAVAVGTTAVTGLAPAPINYSGVTALTIDGGGPSDTFAVTPSTTTTDTLVGGGPVSATPPGNALNMTLTGTTSPALSGTSSAAGAQGAWTFANRSPVNFSHMQSLNPTAVSVADAATTVGGSGSSPLAFTTSLLAASAQPVSAAYATTDGSATAASGAYQPSSGTVSFPAGTTRQTISVSALGQATVRPPQTLRLTLTGPVNALLARAVATGTITDSFAPTPTPTPTPTPNPTPTPAVAPVLSHLTQTHTSWREGKALAVISRRAKRRPPVGTTFSFNLSEPAGATLAFTQTVPGRRAHGRCAAPTRQNRKGKSCRRTVTRGTLRVTGHAGIDHLAFQGRFSPRGKLKRGRYAVVVTAMNTAGQRSRSSALRFSIVK